MMQGLFSFRCRAVPGRAEPSFAPPPVSASRRRFIKSSSRRVPSGFTLFVCNSVLSAPLYHAVQTAICQNQPCAARSLSRRASAPLNGELKNAAQRRFLIPSVHSFPSPASGRRMPAASSCCRTRSSAASSGQIRVCRCTPSVREQSGAALAESSKNRLTS